MMQTIKILNRSIGAGHAPLIVAEISANHHHSLEKAIALVRAAKEVGVEAIKLQTYTPETMTLNANFLIENQKSPWFGKNLYKLYQEAYTPWEWHQEIFKLCRQIGLIGFSTPFDKSAVDFLESLDVPCYKIASLEITDLDLIKAVAQTGKPVMISTGGAALAEIEEAVAVARSAGCKQLMLLKCTTAYPAPAAEANLLTIQDMSKRFKVPVGLSDHTLGLGVSLSSVALGATLIEKHFILSRHEGGPDAHFSLEPAELKMLVHESKAAWQSLGEVSYGPTPSEAASMELRRSLFFIKNVKAGEIISEHMIKALRPNLGLPPKWVDRIVGKKAKRDIAAGTPVKTDQFE